MKRDEAIASRIRAERKRASRDPSWARARHGFTTFEVIKTTPLGQESGNNEQTDVEQQDRGGAGHHAGARGAS